MTANPRGGNYGGAGYQQEGVAVGRCRRGNNPWGHNPECDCRDERPSQVVPYMEPDEDD